MKMKNEKVPISIRRPSIPSANGSIIFSVPKQKEKEKAFKFNIRNVKNSINGIPKTTVNNDHYYNPISTQPRQST